MALKYLFACFPEYEFPTDEFGSFKKGKDCMYTVMLNFNVLQ